MNYADTARIKSVLTNCWRTHTDNITDADIVIFDTCSVKQKAEDKITWRLKGIAPHQKVRITWCMIQHNLRNSKITLDPNKILPDNLKVGNFLGSIQSQTPEIIWATANEINDHKYNPNTKQIWINHAFNPLFYNLIQKRPNIELFFRIDDTGFLPLILNKIGYNVTYDQELINEYINIIPEDMNTSMNHHKKTAYIPISTGCNQFCSYCIVPYARWLEKNIPIEQIITEAKRHLATWVQEIVLLGQIVNKHPQFTEILKEILKLEWLVRLRYTSPYPNFYSPEVLALHETEAKLCPHIHIPFQSGSDLVLKNMRRWYTSEQAKTFINTIQKLKRKISITTDIIVGFPGETEEDFQASLDLARHGQFDMIYIGIYSPRPGTRAHKNLADDISKEVKRDRRNRLNNLLKEISKANNISEIGSSHTMIIDSEDEHTYFGYTENMKQISIKKTDQTFKIGDFIDVTITDWASFKLIGK